jgi:WD40 repeat protein
LECAGRWRAFTISLDSTLVQMSADGRHCAVTTKTNLQFHAFERPTVHREFAEDLGGLLRQATFSRDGRWLAASAAKRVGLWDLATGGPGALSEHGSKHALVFVPEADELFATRIPEGTPAGFRWGIIPATNATAPPRLTRLPLLRPNGFTSLVLYSNRVVMTTTNGTRILERNELERETGAPKWAPTITGISSVSPDGRWLGIYRSFDTALHIYQLPDLKPAIKLTLPASFGTVQFSPLSNELAIGSMRPVTHVKFWSTTAWEPTRTLMNFGRLLYTPDGRGLWLSKDQRTAGLYDASDRSSRSYCYPQAPCHSPSVRMDDIWP